MKKILLVIANYKDDRQRLFDEKVSPINKRYCDKHDFEYLVSNGIDTGRENPIWQKFFYVKKLLSEGSLVDGDKITVLDADMVFVKDEESFETDKSFSYAIDNGNTHCMGNYTITINEWSKRMIDLMLSEERYQAYKDRELWQRWAEQASWYYLCAVLEHSWVPFLNLPNYGWHSHKDKDYIEGDVIFSIEELEEHIEIRPPEWNTTLLEEESSDYIGHMLQKYNIISTKKENTIIRHFAGGQPWGEEYFSEE